MRARVQLTTVLEPRGPAGAVVLTDEQVAALGGNKVPPVKGTVDGKPFTGRVGRMGGENLVGFRRSLREELGVELGDTIEVVLELDDGPRDVALPDELATLLDAEPAARERYDALAPSYRKEYATWVGEAKQAGTRERRAAQALERIREGLPRR